VPIFLLKTLFISEFDDQTQEGQSLRCAHHQAGALQPPHVAGTQEEPLARRAHQRDSKSQPQRPRTFGQSHLQFRDLLRDPDLIQRQDAIIKIPMILFFSVSFVHAASRDDQGKNGHLLPERLDQLGRGHVSDSRVRNVQPDVTGCYKRNSQHHCGYPQLALVFAEFD
jgi:hypothetical protein